MFSLKVKLKINIVQERSEKEIGLFGGVTWYLEMQRNTMMLKDDVKKINSRDG